MEGGVESKGKRVQMVTEKWKNVGGHVWSWCWQTATDCWCLFSCEWTQQQSDSFQTPPRKESEERHRERERHSSPQEAEGVWFIFKSILLLLLQGTLENSGLLQVGSVTAEDIRQSHKLQTIISIWLNFGGKTACEHTQNDGNGEQKSYAQTGTMQSEHLLTF